MRFTKMQGLGNDYIYVNCFQERVEDPARVARLVSDRHFGIGSDGLILIKPSERADFEMEMYNADGSQGMMCGNGIRCVAKYVYDRGLTRRTSITVDTKSGVKHLELTVQGKEVSQVRVDMGAPILEASRIPADVRYLAAETEDGRTGGQEKPGTGDHLSGPGAGDARPIIDECIEVDGTLRSVTCVSMGNPHCVTPVEDVDGLDLAAIGPKFEHHTLFPDRVNTEFVQVIDRHTVKMRVWERGSGETLACGTGACAAAVACILNGWTEEEVTVKLLGGDLRIQWDRGRDTVYMTGPAVTVFEGEINRKEIDHVQD